MSGAKPPNLCPTCRHISANGKVCYAFATHPFKKGVCMAYEPRIVPAGVRLDEERRP